MDQQQDLPKQQPINNAPAVSSMAGKVVGQLQTKSVKPLPSENSEKLLPQPLLDKLWLKMAEMFGHRWTANFGVSADQDHSWAKILGGLNGKQLANGLSAVSTDPQYEWPPSANVFRSLCLQVPGMPGAAEAWTEALIGKYSHEAVKVAAEATGTYDLRTAKHSDKALRQNFERNYAIVQRRAQNAQPLDGKIPAGIGHESKTPRQVQLAASHQEARDLMTAQNIPTDPKAARALLLAKMGIRRPA